MEMSLRHLTRVSILGGALCLVGVSPLATISANTTPVAGHDSAEVSRLLEEAQVAAGKLAITTDHFHSYVRNQLDWRTHAQKAHQVKDEVNTLGAHLADLEALHQQAAPWQQSVIQSMRPILVQIAQNTEFVIQHLSERPRLLAHPEYRDALENKLALATQLAELTNDSVDYAETKKRFEQLRGELELN
jgi:hypothetical protein